MDDNAMATGPSPIATHFAICAIEREHNQTTPTNAMSNWGDIERNADGSSSSPYYQHESTALHHSHSQTDHVDESGQFEDKAQSSPPSWSFAATNETRELSRDGSKHATDEVFNSVSHLSAAMLSFLGMVLLIVQSGSNAWKIVSFSVYGTSLVFLFVCSTFHHAITSTEEVEAKLRMLDYLAIYPLIAGTFTPFCLVFFHHSVIGWSFFGVSWFFAIFGMVLTVIFGPERIPKWMSMTLYITIGWLGAILSFWFLPVIGIGGMGLFILGGLAYTVGGYVYTTEKPNPIPGKFGFHEIWHIAVIIGALLHYTVMYFYVLPWEQ